MKRDLNDRAEELQSDPGLLFAGKDISLFEASVAKALTTEPEFTVETLRGDAITPSPIDWIWKGWLAAGKMHIFGGAPGTGKTTISLDLAATITTGRTWPDGTQCQIGNVLIWSGEDDIEDTLVPRLTLSGADPSRVHFISSMIRGEEKRSFDPARDIPALELKMTEIGNVRLLIVDPIVSAIAVDSHKNAEVRRALQPLADLAASTRCAVLGITHFSKGTSGRDPVERITGSLAFGALARIVLVAATIQDKDFNGHAARLFLRAKSNIGLDNGGFEYDLIQGQSHPGIITSVVRWGKAREGSARELLAVADATGDTAAGSLLDNAKHFLARLLANGPMARKAIEAEAGEVGIRLATLRRAKESLKVEARKVGGSFGGNPQNWCWALPDAEDAQVEPLQANSLKVLNDGEGAQE
jgi:putative DNA primase/helicase